MRNRSTKSFNKNTTKETSRHPVGALLAERYELESFMDGHSVRSVLEGVTLGPVLDEHRHRLNDTGNHTQTAWNYPNSGPYGWSIIHY